MGSDDEFEMLPVKRRGAPISKVNNGLDTSPVGDLPRQLKSGGLVNPLGLNGSDGDVDIILPVKRRGPPAKNINGLSRDPFDKVPTKLHKNSTTGSDSFPTNGINGLDNDPLDRNPPNGMPSSNDLNQVDDSSQFKLQEPYSKVSNGLDNVGIKVTNGETCKLANINIDPEIKHLNNSYHSFAKHRGESENLNELSEDPFDNISIAECSDRIDTLEINSNQASNGLSDVLQNEMLYNPLVNVFDRMGLKDTTNKVHSGRPVDNLPNESSNVCADQSIGFLACQQPSPRKPKGVSFDIETIDPNLKTKFDFPLSDTDIRLGSSSNECIQKQELGDNFDEMFQPIQTSDFIDGLDFLEQCGGNDTEGMEQLQRKSLYVRFDPLCKIKDIVKQSNSIGKETNSINRPAGADLNPVREVSSLAVAEKFADKKLPSSFDDPFSPVKNCGSLKVDKDPKDIVKNNRAYPMNKLVSTNVIGNKLSSQDHTLSKSVNGNFTENLLSSSFDDPFSPVNHPGSSKIDDLKELYPKVKPALNTTGLVEPLLYTQSDMDEVIKKAKFDLDDDVNAREIDWQKKYEELECKIKEEIAMRELIEQDHCGKIDCLRKDNIGMKQVLTQYEKTIVELTENSHHDNKSNEETLAETIRSKEQLQEDLNSAEQNLFDAYKRIEKLKQTIDVYKRNEDNLKENSAELASKLQKSEDRYAKLGEHAREKIDGANALISKVRKQQEVDLAGLQAALKKAQNRVNNLELEIQQKNVENQQLSQICDDLIKKVSGE